MKNQTRWIVLSIILTTVALLTAISVRAAPSAPSAPLGTGFTYQGKLEDESGPISETCDMEFRLYSHATNSSQVGSTIATTVPISDGLFTVELDFGTSAFDGEGRWLGIQVSCPGDSGFTDLGRQELTAAPYALYALKAPWSGLAGVPAGFADGVDNNTTYSAGTGLSLAGTTFNADTTYLQRRVSGTCAAGNAIRVINADGTVTCEAVPGAHDHWGESWTGTGTGLSLSGGTYGVYGSGSASGVYGSGSLSGVYGASGSGHGVRGVSGASGQAGVRGDNNSDGTGVYGSSIEGDGVYGTSGSGDGVIGSTSASSHAGVRGSNSNGYGVEGEGGTGVYGQSNSASGYGVYGFNNSGTGVRGEGSGYGVYGYNDYGGTGVYGFSEFSGYGVYGDSSSGTGVRGVSVSGTAISAEGTGVIKSTADSVLYLSPHDMVIRQDNPGLLSVTPQTGGSVRVRNESGTGTRYLSIPVSTFGQLFGAQVYVKSLEVCYKVTGSSVGYISATTVSKNDGTGTSANYIYDVTSRNSTSYTCYTLDASTPRVPIDNSTWVQFNTTFTGSGSGSDIYVYTVELTLTEQQN